MRRDANLKRSSLWTRVHNRKNYLFAGSDAGGERAASIYTLVQTARLNKLNPETYLRDILAKIADGHPINRIGELVPWKMIPAPGSGPPPTA